MDKLDLRRQHLVEAVTKNGMCVPAADLHYLDAAFALKIDGLYKLFDLVDKRLSFDRIAKFIYILHINHYEF